MRTIFTAVLVFMLAAAYGMTGAAQSGTVAQQDTAAATGNAEAGKGHWALGNTSCRNCHGGAGEGGFGPPLAGLHLTFEQFRDYARNPVGRMPAYVESELTSQEIADMVAYFDSLRPAAKPGAWRFEWPEGAPRGQVLAIAVFGCGQCHGLTMDTPRHGAAEVNADFEWFKRMVYEHTTAQREQWKQLDPALPQVTPRPAGPPGRNRVRMGNYSPARLPESQLKQIWDWVVDLGHLAPLAGQIAAAPTGATYTVKVTNAGVKNKGVTVQDVTVAVQLPAGTTVVSATGPGYQGVHPDPEAKSDAAVWRVPRMAPADQQTLTLTLSKPAETLTGTIRWASPPVKADDVVEFQLARGGRGGRGGG